uniref:F-box domain-containing protein n=1 Tax=Panagrolaimus davidi TaxID=227884 RepID=A0A914PVD6_9BILA
MLKYLNCFSKNRSNNNSVPRLDQKKLRSTDFPINPPKSDFPSDVLKWLKLNASPRFLYKLMKVCKYFQQKEPFFFPIKSLCIYKNNATYSLLNGTESAVIPFKSLPSNLWITKELTFYFDLPKSLSDIFSKISVSDVRELWLKSGKILFKDFKFLTDEGRIRLLKFNGTVVIFHQNDEILVPLETILICVPKIEHIVFANNIVPSFHSNTSAKNLILPKLKKFVLMEFNENFNLELFFDFIKKHKNTEFEVIIKKQEFSPEFTKQLQIQLDKLIKQWSPKYEPISFTFPNQTADSSVALAKLYDQYVKRKFKPGEHLAYYGY